MCTNIAIATVISGAGKGADGWFPINQATVGYDHATHGRQEHALLLDFVNYEIGTGARVAIELNLDSGRTLLRQLRMAIETVEKAAIPENGDERNHLENLSNRSKEASRAESSH